MSDLDEYSQIKSITLTTLPSPTVITQTSETMHVAEDYKPGTFEGNLYYRVLISPYMPCSLYISETHLLLVPREVNEIHPKFPKGPAPPDRIRLEMSEDFKKKFKDEYKRDPKFSVTDVGFGLEDDEVVIGAILKGSQGLKISDEDVANGILQCTPMVFYWKFRNLFKGDLTNVVDSPSDVIASLRTKQYNLKITQVPVLNDEPMVVCGSFGSFDDYASDRF